MCSLSAHALKDASTVHWSACRHKSAAHFQINLLSCVKIVIDGLVSVMALTQRGSGIASVLEYWLMSQDGTLLKGDWQLAIERGDRLEDILHNPKKVGGILRAVQQVSAHEGSLLSEHVLYNLVSRCQSTPSLYVPRHGRSAFLVQRSDSIAGALSTQYLLYRPMETQSWMRPRCLRSPIMMSQYS